MSQASIPAVIQASKEPSTIFGVHKITFAGTDILISWNWPNFRWTITRWCLRGPHAYLPSIIKYQPSRTCILEDGVVIFILVEFYTSIKLRAIFWISKVALPRAFECSFTILPETCNVTFAVNESYYSVGRDADSRGDYRHNILSGCYQILLKTVRM